MSLHTARHGWLLLAALTAGACGANHVDDRAGDGPDRPAGASAVEPGDTVRGVVMVTGAEPLTTVVLRRDDGSSVAIQGPLADTLRAAAGLEVRVAGTRTGDSMEGAAFVVRGLEGLPAADGRLELDGATAVLVTSAGERIRYPAAPAGLRQLAGRRVWIAGPAGGEPQHWGLLEP